MNKFKRYLAIVFCLLIFVVFGILQVPNGFDDRSSVYGSKYPERLTPFDNSVITQLVLW